MAKRATQRQAPDLIARREEFDASALWARSFYDQTWVDEHGRTRQGTDRPPDRGYNNVLWPEVGVKYVVFSYATPIAWIDKDGVAVVTPQRFSQTTSARHQNKLWKFRDDLGGNVRARASARERYQRVIDGYHARKADEARQAKNERARLQRKYERELREEAKRREQDEQAAIRSIANGLPPDEVTLYHVEGEREAIDSILSSRGTRHAKRRRVTTRT